MDGEFFLPQKGADTLIFLTFSNIMRWGAVAMGANLKQSGVFRWQISMSQSS